MISLITIALTRDKLYGDKFLQFVPLQQAVVNGIALPSAIRVESVLLAIHRSVEDVGRRGRPTLLSDMTSSPLGSAVGECWILSMAVTGARL
jgi:hypothetical protein